MVLTLALPFSLFARVNDSIDPDPKHWVPFAFSEGDTIVALKLPPNFHTPEWRHLPEIRYDGENQRQLIAAGYDRASESPGGDFQIQVYFLHIDPSLPAGNMTPDTVHFAIRTARHFSTSSGGTNDTSRPRMEEIADRTWFTYLSAPNDGYYTRFDDHTLLYIFAVYWDATQADPKRLTSRKSIARQVVESVTITP